MNIGKTFRFDIDHSFNHLLLIFKSSTIFFFCVGPTKKLKPNHTMDSTPHKHTHILWYHSDIAMLKRGKKEHSHTYCWLRSIGRVLDDIVINNFLEWWTTQNWHVVFVAIKCAVMRAHRLNVTLFRDFPHSMFLFISPSSPIHRLKFLIG